MTTKDIEWATWCALHDVGKFYRSKRWRAVRRQVLQADHYECQTCRFKYNRYRKADTVHHINPFKLRPDLALEPTYHDPATHKQRRNLAGLIYLRRFRRKNDRLRSICRKCQFDGRHNDPDRCKLFRLPHIRRGRRFGSNTDSGRLHRNQLPRN